jgi:ribosomal protein L16 Arg81 hydroxylase
VNSFKELLSPLAPGIFFSEYWGRKWLLQQGQPARFESLLRWTDIDEILARGPTQLRLVKNGVLVPESNYVKTRHQDHLELRPSRMMDELRSGATLVLDRIDKIHAPIREVAQAIEWATHEAVQVNLYASWGSTRGFDLHWDDHDVLVLHLHGRKAWQVYGMSRAFPVRKDRQPERKFPPPGERLWDGHLNPGDLLYLPRGWWHEVSATAEPTAHLTISIPKRTGFDFLNWLADGLLETDIFRQDLPRHGTAEEKEQHQLRLAEALQKHFSARSLDDFFEAGAALVPSRPHFGLPWQATEHVIPPGTQLIIARSLARRPALHPSPDSASFSFSADGKRLVLPIACQSVVEFVLGRSSVTFAEILATPGCDIGAENLRGLLESMVQNGLVTVREAGDIGIPSTET